MNEIIADLHRHREQLARACDYDAKKLMEHYRRREQERQQSGPSAQLPASAPKTSPAFREEPPGK